MIFSQCLMYKGVWKMFRNVNINDFVDHVTDDGWYCLNMHYFTDNPHVLSNSLELLRAVPTAREKLDSRHRRLNKEERNLYHCPRRGVAVEKSSNAFYINWLNSIIEKYFDHYGDVHDEQAPLNHNAEDINHFICGQHERFQMGKMGMFAPFGKNSLTKSVDDYVQLSREYNDGHLRSADIHVLLQAFEKIRNVDLGGIAPNSIAAVDFEHAVMDSNIGGLATGLFQTARDELLSPQQSCELSKVYDYPFSCERVLYEQLIDYGYNRSPDFSISGNLVTNLKRVQVGGLDKLVENDYTVKTDMFKKAKYRTINANDPIMQMHEAAASIAFREAIKDKCSANFYNTLFDPDEQWKRLEENVRHCYNSGVSQFPFDFNQHDARLHAEWIFNIMMHVVKPLFRLEDQWLIDLSALCLTFKVMTRPKGKSKTFVDFLIGSLGSGDPWTNILGTLGTRLVSWVLCTVRPDVFTCDRLIGMNNGDDTGVGVRTEAIRKLGIDAIIQLANDILHEYLPCYEFNSDKLIIIPDGNGGYIMHWEQYVIWYDSYNDRVMRHGSTLRYFGKIYSAEDAGRQNALEGLIDQLSTINNTIGYVGNHTFMVTAFDLDVISMFIKNDPRLLNNYIKPHGSKFFDVLVKDANSEVLERIKRKYTAKGYNINDPAIATKIQEEADRTLLDHLHVAAYDKDGLATALQTGNFSFLSVTKLVSLGADTLCSIAAQNKGRNLLYSISNDGSLQWMN